MNELILHHYDASPFTQRALRMLGLKRLAWHSVQMPMMPPKHGLVALTGGYRGTPVLQVGAELFIDSQLIARKLEQLHPTPSLFPAGDVGLQLAMVKWSDQFFRSALKIVLGAIADQWPEPFRKDREHLFPDIDFATVGIETWHWRTRLDRRRGAQPRRHPGSSFRRDAARRDAGGGRRIAGRVHASGCMGAAYARDRRRNAN
jgi:glutathione S-transferase